MELTAVDCFSGLGGSSTGAVKAGVKVLAAANHWSKACLTHALNHPNTEHFCQDLRQIDWRIFPKFNVLMASPECRAHTKARGKEVKHHDASRATAWAIIDCIDVCKPKFLVVENVPEFKNWKHYERWCACLDDYHLAENILDSANFGVPQHRVRLFITGVLKKVSKTPIYVDEPTLPYVPASSIIDWESINWTKIYTKDRAENTIRRIEAGKDQFGKKPFLVSYFGSTSGGRSLDRPIGTITTKDRYALVDGNYMRMLNIIEYKRAMGFDKEYILPHCHQDALKLLGNAVVPAVMTRIIKKFKKHSLC